MRVFIARLSIPAEAFRESLRAIPGAVYVRELPPDRVVVSLASGGAAALAGLEGVEAVTEDRLEHFGQE